MLENLEKYKIILASNSPRRKELLSGLGIKYEKKSTTFVADLLVLWCNGSTTVFGSVSGGSNPPGTTGHK